MDQQGRSALRTVYHFLMVLVCLTMLIPHRICLCCPCLAHHSNPMFTNVDGPPEPERIEEDDSCPCHHRNTPQPSIPTTPKECTHSGPTHDNHSPSCPTKNPVPTIIQADESIPLLNHISTALCWYGYQVASNSTGMPFHSSKNICRNDHQDVIHLYCRLII